MKPAFMWRGNDEDKSGRAIFTLGDKIANVELESFAVANAIGNMIMDAYREGAKDGQQVLVGSIQRLMDKSLRDL